MGYEYEETIRSSVEMELFRHGHHDFEYDAEVIKELKEVYAKAKAFDEILKVDYQATEEDRLTGKYESDIEIIIGDYMEDK